MNDFKPHTFDMLPIGAVFKCITRKQDNEHGTLDKFLKYYEIPGGEFEKISEKEIKNITDLKDKAFQVDDLPSIFSDLFPNTSIIYPGGWDYVYYAVYKPLNFKDYFLNCSWQFLVGLIFGLIPFLSLFVVVSLICLVWNNNDPVKFFENGIWAFEPLPRLFKFLGFIIGFYVVWEFLPLVSIWISFLDYDH